MKTLTDKEFLSLKFQLDKCELSHDEFIRHEDPYSDDKTHQRFESWAVGNVIINTKCGVELEFGWMAQGGERSYQDAFEFEISIDWNAEAELRGAVLVDEDGDKLDTSEASNVFSELLSTTEWESGVDELLPEPEIEEIDINEDLNMKTQTVERDDDRTIKFTGEQIGWASTCQQETRWTELTLYRTQGGKYICEKIHHTRWSTEETGYCGSVCNTIDEVIEYFGMSWAAKELYEDADIDVSLEVA